MDLAVANMFERNMSKLLSKYLLRDLDPMKVQNPHVELLDKIFELTQKWKPPLGKLMTSVRTLAEVVQADEIALSHQVYFLQSLANLDHLKASSPSQASKLLLECLAGLKQQNCWTKAFGCCMIRNFVKQLDYADDTIVSKLSDINDILKRSLLDTSGSKDHEVYRVVCVTTISELVITWCKKLPNKISHIEAPSGPSRSLTPLFGVLDTNPISPFLRWTTLECIRRQIMLGSLWYCVSLGQMNNFMNLCTKSIIDYRNGQLDSVSLVLLLSALTHSNAFLTALETPEIVCELISNQLLILQPLFVPIKDDTRAYELRFACLRFIGRFVCEFVPPIPEDPHQEPNTPGMSITDIENFAKRYHSFCCGNPEQESALHAEIQDAYALYISELGLGQEEAPRILTPKILD